MKFLISGCWIANEGIHGTSNFGQRGYPMISIDGKQYRLSHVVKLIYEQITIWDLNKDQTDYVVCPGHYPRMKVDASHLCHNPLCFNPEHIRFEPTNVNLARNGCLVKKKCFGHKMYPSCIINNIVPQEITNDDEISDFEDEISLKKHPKQRATTKIGRDAVHIIRKYQFNVSQDKQTNGKSLRAKRRIQPKK